MVSRSTRSPLYIFLLMCVLVWCWGWDGAGDLDGPDVEPIWERMPNASTIPDAVRVRHNRGFKFH